MPAVAEAVAVKGAPHGAPATSGHSAGVSAPVPDALERLLLRAKLTRAEWEQMRPCCRLTMRTTIFGVRYRYVAVELPDGSFFNVVEGPNDAPGALAWWSRLLEVRTADL